jgi:hypothetical protein
MPHASGVPARTDRVTGPDTDPDPDTPKSVMAIFRPYAAASIDFDVDLRELQGQVQLNVLCGFLRAIGRSLGKPVLLSPETDSGHPVLGFDVEADRVVLLAYPRFTGSHRSLSC